MKSKYEHYMQGEPTEIRWKVACYVRLSKEDGDKAVSDSVASQREILKEYVNNHPDMEIVDYYIDDGFSGTSFNRPAFQRMIDDIKAGVINCVLVKDLSRFGRNAAQAGIFIDELFPRYGIRFIAVNNNHDSLSTTSNAMTDCIMLGVTNVINESVSATTSVNIRATLNVNRQQGWFIGSHACYGFKKSDEDHHKLLVDEEAAVVVRRIYNEYLSGKSIIGIAKDLNDSGIPCPSAYKKLKGFRYRQPQAPDGEAFWSDRTVRRILEHRMYVGDMVQGKNTKISYKHQQCRAVPKENWIIVENTHEPIIDRDTFDKVQALLGSGARHSPKTQKVDLFSGLVRCADCKRVMNKKTNVHSYGTYHYYRCATRRRLSAEACTNHTIRFDKLEQAVLVTVQKMIDMAVSVDDVLAQIRKSDHRLTESAHLQATLAAHIHERDKLSHIVTESYMDWKNGDLTKAEYWQLKTQLAEKISALEKHIASIEKSIADFADGFTNENEFVEHFKKHGNVDRLTRSLVTELIDCIYVHEGGDIEIVFKFNDAYEQAMAYIAENQASIEEKTA